VNSINPIHTEIVLVGGGHSHAIALRMFGMKPLKGVRLTLISEGSDSPYSGMLPGYVAGYYLREQCHIDLRSLSQFAGAQFYQDQVVGIDLVNQRVICANRPPVAFDYLCLDIGSIPQKLDSNNSKSITAKPISKFLAHWQQFLTDLAKQSPENLAIAIAGGGVGGVELAISIHQRFIDFIPNTRLDFHLFHKGEELLTGHNSQVRRLVAKELERRKIQVHLKEEVIGLEQGFVQCYSGKTWECDRLFWVTQATAPDWLSSSGLAVDEDGFVLIKNTLQSISHAQVFATGDIATNTQHPRPKAGVFAVRQGKPLFQNLQKIVSQLPLKEYIPQKKFLSLIGTANGEAIASKGIFGWRSPVMWWWKDRIDRQFMAKFTDFPRMEVTESQMYCAGCGSKVGSNTLREVLARLPQITPQTINEGILIGLNQADDACAIEIPAGQVLVQSLDYFPAFLNDPYLVGQIAANHCLNDLFAMAANPHSALAIATVSHGTPKAEAETLFQLLAGATKVLNAARSPLIGGHTTVGQELIFGLSCNGYADPKHLLRKAGIQVGDALILTKPLGTGVILAAAMQNKCEKEWLDQAINSMLQSNQAAIQIFQACQIHACTDISGFGLIGHLSEMLNAAKISTRVSAKIELAKIPTLLGAIATQKMGIFSSLYAQNRQAEKLISQPQAQSNAQNPIYSLLFDPQTSGGLLGAVPQDQAILCLTKLREQGYAQAQIIGVAIEPKEASTELQIQMIA